MSETMEPTPASDLILYQTEDGKTRIQCRFEDESIWLTQAQIAELFQTTPQNITQHIRSIDDENDLGEMATCKSSLHVGQVKPQSSSDHPSGLMVVSETSKPFTSQTPQ